ncbi:MAG: lysine--tRNA ligase [Methylacidiphilales bacterium]|nr:lysine--tRNA ligase [Candidatus Methylacidiphilales bacterium]
MDDSNHLFKDRLDKIKQWLIDSPYPNNFSRTTEAAEIPSLYQLGNVEKSYSLAGRLKAKRVMGKSSFFVLEDYSGTIQLYLSHAVLENYDSCVHFDVGDIVGVQGTIFVTKTGEVSLKITFCQLLSKCLIPLPEKYHGLKDEELRVRKRYLDLIMSSERRNLFKTRSSIVTEVRDYLHSLGFLEVETPMMHPIAGGASAKPFVTFHNELEQEMFLRVAPELYLKRLIVGGFEKVFELNRNFRNEGVSTRHNPEFTMVEMYQAYADFNVMMDLCESLFAHVIKKCTTQSLGQTPLFPCRRVTMEETVETACPTLIGKTRDTQALLSYCLTQAIPVESHWGSGKLLCEIFEKKVEHTLQAPTFVTHYPLEVSPLARTNDDDQEVTDRFEFFIGGREIANGFSELNNPIDQENRFKLQQRLKETGDSEAMPFDQDYITALQYAMPPTAGMGIGIDRLVMVLTNSPSIRDVILFPLVRQDQS